MRYETGSIGTDPQLALAAPPRSRRRAMLVAVVTIVVLAIAALVFGHRKPTAASHSATDQIPQVTVIQPGRRTIDRTLSATGSLAARVDMPVGVAGEGGKVTAVLVQPGQWVQAGQVLATLDRSVQQETAASLAASIKVAQADATLAQSALDRAQQLVGRGFISKADIESKAATRDAADARVKMAQAQLAQQRAANSRLDVRAPAEGLVLTRQIEPGQVVGASTGTLFRMARGGEMEMRALLAENDLAIVHAGSVAKVTPVGSAVSFPGTVWQVSPVIDPASRQGIARVALRYDPALRPGGFAAATITSGASVAPLLPQSAIQSDDKGNYVYVVGTGDTVQRRSVTLGNVSDDGVAVAAGLDGTEKVVMSAGAFLNVGQRIRPILRAVG
ncbi:efflux RND transporter periplasmic adaptor subunit [Sphingomonas bacterium]|uniref:efflux RND transporter periplasmic adaptor subunit n=1 Tax=Sphingomonas bacterium TaxID=1895847 RepID=UPI0015774261|nr:efflux RND transporter periplasmic adaptor subunit [Sphingomonas bacterium]